MEKYPGNKMLGHREIVDGKVLLSNLLILLALDDVCILSTPCRIIDHYVYNYMFMFCRLEVMSG